MPVLPNQFPEPSQYQLLPEQVMLDPLALKFARAVANAGGRALVVGGFVRDCWFGRPTRDIDIEVYGLPAAELEALTTRIVSSRPVGKDFGILKAGPLDISLPRRDRTPGHDGFQSGDPDLSLKEASWRRDFTVNAMAWDPLTHEVFDPWQGMEALQRGVLEPVSEETFVEDPLRALRAIQFVARYPLELGPRARALCAALAPVLPTLPRERIFEELKKLLLKGRRLSWALEAGRSTGVITSLIPELARALQDPLIGQALAISQSTLPDDEREALAVQLAIFLHPLVGKLALARDQMQPMSDPPTGLEQIALVLGRFTSDKRLRATTFSILLNLDAPLQLYSFNQTDAAVRRLSTQVSIDLLERSARALALAGESTLEIQKGWGPGAWLRSRAVVLGVLNFPPPPLIQGRDLTGLGLPPGPRMGRILRALYEVQLDGVISIREEGLQLAASWVSASDQELG